MIFRWCFLLLIVLSAPLRADELISFGENPRSTGMGGVRLLKNDGTDAEAIFWNPAALARITGIRWSIFNITGGTNGYEVAQDLANLDGGGLSALDPFYGKRVWVGALGYSAIAVPYFGFGIFNQGYTRFLLRNPAFPELDVTYISDYGYALAGALDFGGLSMGLTLKRIVRTGGMRTVGTDLLTDFSLESLSSLFTDEGVGHGIDFGLMYRVPMPLNPTLSLSWQNLGTINFIQSKGTQSVPRLLDNLTLGASVSSQLPVIGFSAGMEIRHVTQTSENLGKKVHLGAELNLPIVDLRAGFYQGYYTYGLGLDFMVFQVDASMYKVETGFYPGQTPEDRFLLSISAAVSFDPNFKLITEGAGGKRRRFKQRR